MRNGFNFGCKECIVLVLIHFALFVELGYKFDVGFEIASNVRNRQLCQLNPCLPIQTNNVAANIWRTLIANNDDSVVTARLDLISPNLGFAEVLFVRASYFDSIFVALLNSVVYYVRVVVEHFNADHI